MHTVPIVTAPPPESPRARTRAVQFAFIALLLGMLMAQLDTNVVVAALPSIGAGLGDPSGVAGVTAVYLLTVTVSTPVHGKLGDLLGRRFIFVLSVILFALGSLACSAAPSLPALIAARAFQGVGGGGLVVTAISALGEMFDRDERVKRQIWLTGVLAMSSLVGPPLGGFVASGPGWRWIFLVNPPICIAALILGSRGLPGQHRTGALRGFDTLGAALIAAAGGGVVTLGSSQTVATSPVWAPLVLAAVLLCLLAFIHVERHVVSPLIPPSLFSSSDLARSIAVTGLTGIALFGTFTFIPLAITAGTGATNGQVGTLLLALTLGQLAVMTTFSFLARRYPQMTAWGRLGLSMGVVGLLLIAAVPVLPVGTKPLATGLAIAGMALAGAALGLSMQAYTLLAQNTASRDSFGAAMGTLTFARQLGGSLGAAAFGWLLLTVPNRDTALAIILAAAAAVVAVSALIAPPAPTEPPPQTLSGLRPSGCTPIHALDGRARTEVEFQPYGHPASRTSTGRQAARGRWHGTTAGRARAPSPNGRARCTRSGPAAPQGPPSGCSPGSAHLAHGAATDGDRGRNVDLGRESARRRKSRRPRPCRHRSRGRCWLLRAGAALTLSPAIASLRFCCWSADLRRLVGRVAVDSREVTNRFTVW